MLVGAFEVLWGTAEGAALQSWCAARGWPLAWAANPAVSLVGCGPSGTYPACVVPANISAGGDPANERLLDLAVLPRVPAGRNVTSASPADAEFFRERWAAVNASALTPAQLAAEWKGLFERLRAAAGVEPLYAGACADTECFGVAVESRHCVCTA